MTRLHFGFTFVNCAIDIVEWDSFKQIDDRYDGYLPKH